MKRYTAKHYEEEVVAHLKAQLEDSYVAVEAFPDKPEDYVVKHQKGVVLVRYTGSEYGRKPLDSSAQERTVNMELVLYYRSLRGQQGMYAIMDAASSAMYAWKADWMLGSPRIVRDDVVGEVNGLWQVGMKLSLHSYFIPKQETISEPSLTAIIHEY